MGIALSAMGGGLLLGPPLGGFLYERAGASAAFLAATALAVGDGIARWVLIRDVGGEPVRERAGRLWRQPGIPLIAVLTFLGAALLSYLEPILPLHLTRSSSTSPQTIGLLFGLASLATILAATARLWLSLPVKAE
jgi:hypothetical protein